MRIIKSFFLLSIFFAFSLQAQPYKLDFNIYYSAADQVAGTPVGWDAIQEGGSVAVAMSTFNPGFELFQVFYNAVVGAEFGLPAGALNENVEIKVNLEAFKNVTLAQIQANPESMFATFFNTLTVIGATSGVFNAGNPLILNGGLEAYLKVPVPNIQALAAGFGVPYNDLVDAYNAIGLTVPGVRVDVTDTFVTIFFSQFASGSRSLLVAVEDNVYSSIPTDYSLEQNYPNPFNPSTAIRYSIPQEGYVSLRVYNLIGSEIATLINGYRDAGTYEVRFNATDLASGTYFYALTVNNFMSTKKMSVVK